MDALPRGRHLLSRTLTRQERIEHLTEETKQRGPERRQRDPEPAAAVTVAEQPATRRSRLATSRRPRTEPDEPPEAAADRRRRHRSGAGARRADADPAEDPPPSRADEPEAERPPSRQPKPNRSRKPSRRPTTIAAARVEPASTRRERRRRRRGPTRRRGAAPVELTDVPSRRRWPSSWTAPTTR